MKKENLIINTSYCAFNILGKVFYLKIKLSIVNYKSSIDLIGRWI